MASFKTLDDVEVAGKRVLVRVDLNVPMADGQVTDATRILRILPTITLSDMIGKPVSFSTDCIGPMAEAAISAMHDGDVTLLENTRFHEGEEKNDDAFAAELAKNGDLFVSDAFSASHRAHASTEGLARHMEAVAGRTMQAELEALEAGLGDPERPVIAIVKLRNHPAGRCYRRRRICSQCTQCQCSGNTMP